MNLFKRTKLADERIINLKNKIYAEIYVLVTVICAVSSIVKYFIYDMEIEGIVTELAILIISGFYYLYRSITLGIASAEIELHDAKSKWPQRKKNFVFSVSLGVIIALIFGVNSAVRYADGIGQSIWYFFLVTFVSLMIYLPFFIITIVIGNDAIQKKSNDVVNKMFIAEESGENNEEY